MRISEAGKVPLGPNTLLSVPFKASFDAELKGGQVDCAFMPQFMVESDLTDPKAGKLRAVATTAPKANTSMAKLTVPAIKESKTASSFGELTAWAGILGHKDMNPNMRKCLNEMVQDVLDNAKVGEEFRKKGLLRKTGDPRTSEEFKGFISAEMEVWKPSAKLIDESTEGGKAEGPADKKGVDGKVGPG